MELWDWNVANKDFWSRLAKSLHSQKVSVTWAGKMDKKLASVLVLEKMSWATATRSIRKCKTRIEKIGGSRVDTEATAWQHINFVVGNRRSVFESDLYTKLKKLDIQEGKKDKLFADHVTQVCEAHNWVIVSFLQQVQGGTRPTTEGTRENIGHSVHV